MHHIFITIHVWASILFSIVAVVFVFSLIKGIIHKSDYNRKLLFLENSFIILLYFGLILGISLYFFIPQDNNVVMSMQQAQKAINSRFWSIEHFSVMLFALMLAQIGKIFTVRTTYSHSKFKYAIFYYGSATLITFISTAFFLAYRIS